MHHFNSSFYKKDIVVILVFVCFVFLDKVLKYRFPAKYISLKNTFPFILWTFSVFIPWCGQTVRNSERLAWGSFMTWTQMNDKGRLFWLRDCVKVTSGVKYYWQSQGSAYKSNILIIFFLCKKTFYQRPTFVTIKNTRSFFAFPPSNLHTVPKDNHDFFHDFFFFVL